jgi:hypothetical protein
MVANTPFLCSGYSTDRRRRHEGTNKRNRLFEEVGNTKIPFQTVLIAAVALVALVVGLL